VSIFLTIFNRDETPCLCLCLIDCTKAYTKPPRKSLHWKPQHRTKTLQFEKWVDPNNYIYSNRSIPTSFFMSNYKPIQFKLFGAILTKMEFFWSSTYFFMLFQISTTISRECGDKQVYTVWQINIWKSFHMVSGTTSGLVGTKYISNWNLELSNLCLVSRIWIGFFLSFFWISNRSCKNKKNYFKKKIVILLFLFFIKKLI
jgi:hypothetical protein